MQRVFSYMRVAPGGAEESTEDTKVRSSRRSTVANYMRNHLWMHEPSDRGKFRREVGLFFGFRV